MQGMTGIELAILFEREVPACKVLLFSGQVDAPELIRQAKKPGIPSAFCRNRFIRQNWWRR